MTLSKAKHIARKMVMILSAMLMPVLVSCDSFIYDYEGDCDPHYKVRFRFDWNLHFADAFPNEVNLVNLYIINTENGKIVWQKSESGEALKADGYMMDVDGLQPGNYKLIAWCGEGVGPHFTVPQAEHHTGLTCTLSRDHEENHPGGVVRNNLHRLYYGHIESQEFPDEEGVHIITMPLLKNTNEVNVVLQHMSGDPVDKNDYTFTVTGSNGSMDWDNSLIDDETITYYAHTIQSGTAGLDMPETAELKSKAPITHMSACVASHTISRLTTDRKDDVKVTIYNKNNEVILSIPLIQYALLVKGSYSNMDDQEYLDRQDKFDLVFFLDEKDKWMSAYIYINSWKLVLQEHDL